MFYSQFILAKKGPLGTIWIAAHLERKLRKNQVADTDIGVSVDSILFPEVPIALRLSSHLLLGVVRIYSRKVNYLFHDCSEALLKIRQAFRSTAVDLPPEESTAPYHSITLPETFHLDDFELPDSAIQGDFIDHHVSTKEQITLQDTMDGTGYLTLQFGLDERFGDGNASQIGLELDEDLFLEDNHLTSQHVSSTMAPDESAVHQSQTSYSVPPTHMDIDDDQNGLVKDIDIEASQDLSNLHERHVHPSMVHEKMNNVSSQWQGYNIQTPDLNEVFSPTDHIEGPSAAPSKIIIGSTADEVPSPDLAEGAHAPSTPGLMEEMFSANIHESPALSPQQKPSPSIGEETIRPENSNIHFECPDLVTDGGAMHSVTVAPDSANIMQVVSSPTSELSERRGQITTPDETQMGCGQKSVSELQDGYVCSQVKDLTVDKQAQDNGEAILSEVAQPSSCCSVEHVEDVNPCYNGDASAVSSDLHFRPCTSLVNQANALSAQDGALTQKVPVVSVEEPCVPSQTSVQENKLHASESSFEMQGKDSHMANSTNAELEVQENPQDVSTESALFASNTNELLADLSKNDTQRNELNCSSCSEFPEPEKMLLAPTGDVEQANELSQVTEEKGVVESDGSVDRMTSLSGKKRHLMETTSALLNGSSGKMSGRSRLRRNTENVPDDDDLLASILVGKRTPLLKIGPTPPPPKATSLKRPWLAPRLRMPKRKVLLDDTTVLHADAIRQQLMNTEDIRRMRKKAPCTRPEIWMIQQSSLEDEIFNEPIVTGISAQLNGLHVQRYDSETNQNNSRDEPPKEYGPSRNLEFVREANETEKTELILVMPENVDVETPGLSRVSLPTKVQSSKDMEVCDDQEQSVPALPLLDQSGNDGQCMMLTTEISVKDKISGADTPMPLAAPAPSRLECEVTPTDSTADDLVQTRDNSSVVNGEALHVTENASAEDLAFADGDSKGRVVDNNAFAIVNDDPTMHVEEAHTATDVSIVDRSMMSLDAITLNDPQDICRAAKRVNSDALVSELYNISRECEAGLATDSSTIVHEGDMSLQDVVRESGATDPLAVTGNLIVDEREGVGAKVENKALVQKLMHNEGNLNTDVSCSEGEGPGTVSVSLTQTTIETEIVPPAVFGSTPMDMAIAKECSDFCSAIDGNDTEFLNIDDETDYHEEGDNDVPNAEDAALENSGWSSRTRNVARYLKGWFDEASGLGRKSVAMDHLIAGRTRKEASRMFFETLILKTKDYIHVEQENPANYIIIRPRAKLLKAEF